MEWVRQDKNNEARIYCKQKVKESLIIEQDPHKREEEITMEALGDDEVV